MKEIHNKGVACATPQTIAAGFLLALVFTFSGCSGDDGKGDDGGGGYNNGSSKNSCIKTELAIKANTLDDIVVTCNATRGEVLSQLPNSIGSCNKNDLDFDKPIKDITASCGVSEIPIVSSSSSFKASSSSGNSSSSSSNVQQIGKIEGTPVAYQGKTYKTVVIGTQTWMAENLNYEVEGSKCGDDGYVLVDNNTPTCNIYGRLYDWSTAMALPSYCNSTVCSEQIGTKHRGICPPDWHIPTEAEWEALINYVQNGCGYCEGMHLKATSGWLGNGGNGHDTYGFSALPAGEGYSSSFVKAGDITFLWSSSEYVNGITYYNDGKKIYVWRIFGDQSRTEYCSCDKSSLFSVRCIKD
jgi:uncharacterized protein (TIGR02145 family)